MLGNSDCIRQVWFASSKPKHVWMQQARTCRSAVNIHRTAAPFQRLCVTDRVHNAIIGARCS